MEVTVSGELGQQDGNDVLLHRVRESHSQRQLRLRTLTSSLAPSRVARPIFTSTLPHSTTHTSTTCTQTTSPTSPSVMVTGYHDKWSELEAFGERREHTHHLKMERGCGNSLRGEGGS